jgi:phospholipase/carboxylesterase
MTEKTAPRLSIIALHGVADTDRQIEQAFGYVMRHISSPQIRWVFPRAPRRPVGLLGGSEAFAWYDIRTHDRSWLDVAGIHDAVARVRAVIRAERARLGREQRLAVVGFSQGGALALQAGLAAGEKVDGIVGLSTAVPLPEEIQPAPSGAPRIFLGHGTRDPELPFDFGLETCNGLRSKGYDVEWHEYRARHTVEGRELRDVARWLDRHFLSRAAARPARSSAAFEIRTDSL